MEIESVYPCCVFVEPPEAKALQNSVGIAVESHCFGSSIGGCGEVTSKMRFSRLTLGAQGLGSAAYSSLILVASSRDKRSRLLNDIEPLSLFSCCSKCFLHTHSVQSCKAHRRRKGLKQQRRSLEL